MHDLLLKGAWRINNKKRRENTLKRSERMEGVMSLYLGASERSLSYEAWSNSTILFTFSFCFPLLHFCSHKNPPQTHIMSQKLRNFLVPSFTEKQTETKWRNNKMKIERIYESFMGRTFFFCLPPPDLAGLDEGGGAFSFFGAWKQNQNPTPR